MPNIELLEKSMPVAPIRIAALEGCRELAEEVDRNLVKFRKELVEKKGLDNIPQGYSEDSFIVECECPRFGTGEGKGIIKESVRGTDLYIMVDVTNYSSTYTVCGHENHMSPDNHFQDLKRIISAATGKAHRINVIMPFLYEGRQHRRKKRESLDCALALRELSDMGVANIITFDAHDPRVQNSIPLNGFDNFFPTYQFLKALIKNVDNFQVDNDHLMIISPDEGAMSRAVYFSNILGVDMGMFYKRRDYSTVVNGKNPIVAHEFLGDSVEGKDVVIIDDMISSGESMLDVAKQIKERHANRVFICTTYGLFTEGMDKFDAYYEKGWIDKVITTNLNYRIPELLTRPYYVEANMSKYLASIMDIINQTINKQSPVPPYLVCGTGLLYIYIFAWIVNRIYTCLSHYFSRRMPRKAARFPLLPWDALWEKRNSGLQQVQIPGMEICSSFIPASRKIMWFASQRSNWYLPFFFL